MSGNMEPVSAFEYYNKSKKINKTSKQKNNKRILKGSAYNLSNGTVNKINKKLKTKCSQRSKITKAKNTKKITESKKVASNIKKQNISINGSSTSTKVNNTSLVKKLPEMSNTDLVLADSSTESIDFTPVQTNSVEEGLKVFQWIIAPYNPHDFLNRIWEKKPLHISRKKPLYYKEIISTPVIDDMLRKNNIIFTKNIDITSYVDGKRETHNPVGRAHSHVVWDYYLNGCSIRLLNPQTYIPCLHLLNATLQEFFNSFVGANAYLTPPDSQGFAPHYDDIEAFILQIEGKKRWRLYKPITENEVLPRVSSKNFNQDEIGEPIQEVILEAGDVLYFPRGYIHQGVTVDGQHSLHITISMYQKHSWADLFEKMLPVALNEAIAENVDFRRGLPFDIYDNFGLVNSDINNQRKQEISNIIKTLFDKIKAHLHVDSVVDEMAKNYQHDALPPVLSDIEKDVTIYGDSDVMVANGIVTRRVEIDLDTKIRLLRKNILRMVMEEKIRIYFHSENSLEFHGNDLQYLEIDEQLAPAIETLVAAYPKYISVENLGMPDDSDKLQVANDLWEKGLIMTEYPLENIDD